MNRACMYSFVLVCCGAGDAVCAHHSIAGVYDSSVAVTVEGEVREFEFVSPHPLLIIEVIDPESAPQTWTLEMDNRFELSRIGISADTFKPGDYVVVTGSPSRAAAARLYLRKLDRPADGFRYEQIGSRPKISNGPISGGLLLVE